MNVGYVRLSRDDDKKNYTSIENQKSLILAYAKQNGITVDRFYEDDGVSGYIFSRPSLNALLDDLENNLIETVIAKDLSRIGRNNPKVLLLIERFRELEKKLIIIDDNFDSSTSDDDIIGIKTWYNERYVKDASKKIRSIVKMKQEEGSYICNAPLGYYINNKKFLVRENEAELVKRIFDMYISGYGYRNIANILNEDNIQTPSVLIMQNFLGEGKSYKKHVTTKWSDNMVRDILKNDFYIGVFRNRKRERKTIHGIDKRVSKENQCVFNDNHEKIIDETTYNLAQELMVSRKRSNYRGSRNNEISIFGSVLYCSDCGAKLTPITRTTKNGTRRYYICSKYNSDGKNFCSAHLIDDSELIDFTNEFIKASKLELEKLIKSYNINDYKNNKDVSQNQINVINKKVEELKNKLKSIISMKLNDMSKYSDMSVIEETYTAMQNEIVNNINNCEAELNKLRERFDENFEQEFENINNAYEIIKSIKESFDRKDIENIIEKIIVDDHGIPKYILRYNISNYIKHTVYDIINERENNIIKEVLEIIRKEERSYTSAKYISKKLNEIGISKSKKSVLPYINKAIKKGVLEKTDDPLKPYNIIISKDEI